MHLNRRDFLKMVGAGGVALWLPLSLIEKALAGNGDPRVIWLQGLSCTGCSVSLLNSVNLTTVDDLLLNKINMEYHSTLIASAGDLALNNALGMHPSLDELQGFGDQWLKTGSGLEFDLNNDGIVNLIDFAKLANQGYILVVEGAIPTGADGNYCHVGNGLTMLRAFDLFSEKTNLIIAVGTCASFGGIPAAAPNLTGAKSVSDTLTYLGRTRTVINIPGCPIHPDWFVGTVVKALAGQTISLDAQKRPLDYFSQTVHSRCPYRDHYEEIDNLGELGCYKEIGCKGPKTRANCPILKWNNPGQGQNGVNWCVQARTPCTGCTEPTFPDGMMPFYKPKN
jgi:hydrogenase small subunit